MQHTRSPESRLSDTNLIDQCLSGNPEAQAMLYREYFESPGPVHYWVYQRAYWIPEGEKEDILNDIFIAVMASLKNFEFKSSLRTYIVRIAKIKCLDALPARLGVAKGRGIQFVDIDQRQYDGEQVFQIEDPNQQNRPDSLFAALEEEERVYLLQKALTTCTGARCREVLLLYIKELHEEITRADVANRLGVPIERASQMIYDCLYRLRKKTQALFRDYQHFADSLYDTPQQNHTLLKRVEHRKPASAGFQAASDTLSRGKFQ